ncbi:unnamed protein product [Allacma fusca]|uniref:Uncharacterized protein n=1 Tax=Allacma fusca TaxID=39272 RepID=A0A8J2JEP4_9HEXA|nr:unnamed protein product [Allacma fusca]
MGVRPGITSHEKFSGNKVICFSNQMIQFLIFFLRFVAKSTSEIRDQKKHCARIASEQLNRIVRHGWTSRRAAWLKEIRVGVGGGQSIGPFKQATLHRQIMFTAQILFGGSQILLHFFYKIGGWEYFLQAILQFIVIVVCDLQFFPVRFKG